MSDNFTDLNEEQQAVSMPYFIHEGEMSRMERSNRRWFIAFLIVLIMLFATNAGWINYDHQFETYGIEQSVDTGVGPAYVTGVGDVSYGQNSAKNPGAGQEDKQPESNENLP